MQQSLTVSAATGGSAAAAAGKMPPLAGLAEVAAMAAMAAEVRWWGCCLSSTPGGAVQAGFGVEGMVVSWAGLLGYWEKMTMSSRLTRPTSH